jgi:3-oxoacyl-[acyl-carrier-protein] synthase III
MIGIVSIGTYIPAGRINNLRRMEQFGVDKAFLSEKTGMLRLAVKAENEETSDLCCKAFDDLRVKTKIRPENLECIVVCTQNPDSHGMPHTSAIVHAKLKLPESCAAFDISMGCSGFVYGLSVIQAFMLANGYRNGVLFTADPYSKVIDDSDKNTSLLFGDGATATLIGGAPVWRSGKFLFRSYGQERDSIQVQHKTGKLAMNGRAVFSFSASKVPENITAMLALNGLALENIDCFALHQGSRYIIDTLQKRLGVDEEKVPFVAADYGNTVSSSIPLILGQISIDLKIIVIAGFGVGLSCASTVLLRVD